MGATVGTASLNVTDFSFEAETVGPEWWAWENESLTRKKFVYGQKRVWRLDCLEKDVAWTSSAAKYLMEQAAEGNILAFNADIGDRYNVSNVNVLVENVTVTMEQVGAQNIRRFTVVLKEV
ncbi:MAG: hypothetical protein QXK47_05210 [Candidatus Bathyarchaeia archaeon]